MSQRKKLNNPATNYSLKDQFLQQTGQPLPVANDTVCHESPAVREVTEEPARKRKAEKSSSSSESYEWDRWTIICRKDFKQGITAIAEKEGFTIREIVEKFFTDGIAAYEAKHGVIDRTPKKKKDIDSLT